MRRYSTFEFIRTRQKAQAMQVHAFQARDGELAEDADEIIKRAKRRLGEVMKEIPKAKGTRGVGRPKKGGIKNTPPKNVLSLADHGIDKNLAEQARKAAALSEDDFEKSVVDARRLAKATAEGDKAIVRAARERRHLETKQRRATREKGTCRQDRRTAKKN